MKTLYLMRHAKSSWDHPEMADIKRPLLQEGIDSTKKVVDYFRQNHINIKHIASSPAVRTIETAKLITHGLRLSHDSIDVFDDLYRADTSAFENCIFSLPDDWDHVLMIGHNPGISNFAHGFMAEKEEIPTAGVLSVSFNIEKWIHLYTAPPILNFFIHPKKL